MKMFGFSIERAKKKSFQSVPSNSWWWAVRESFTGAWQSNVELESRENLLAFSAVFACVSLIVDDISKLYLCLKWQDKASGIWRDVPYNSPYWAVLRKPNSYQTRVQFLSLWVTSKLLYGNAYILKERDARGIVNAMYVLDPRRVQPLVTELGDVYYRLSVDWLNHVENNGVDNNPVLPASYIIHDRMLCLWHPLVGISPITACGTSGTQGLRIQNNSAKFFGNMSRPSGHLTAPDAISDETALRLKTDFEKNFSGGNLGRLLVTGDGLKYEPFTIPANDSQLIEQLKWTVEDVARCFKVPLYKLGLAAPPASSIPALAQDYYSQTLQIYIEAIEILLDEGLGLVGGPIPYGTEFDLEGLLRMDPTARADKNAKAIGAGYLKPNEARQFEDLEPVEGGDECYLQQQNFSLAALAKRDAQADPFTPGSPPSAASEEPQTIAPPAEVPETPAEESAAADVMFWKELAERGRVQLVDAVIERFNSADALEITEDAV